MALIYVVDHEYNADIKVFNEAKDCKAELLYYEVDKEYKAKGDELWYFVDKENKATTTIFWVENEHQAELKVCKVDKNNKVKWNKCHPYRFRL